MNAQLEHNKRLKNWGFKGANPLLIAGPCSAESEEQLLTTAKQIANTGKASALRAGVWKPRTRPGSFEGIGSPALAWLVKAKQVTGLPVLTEVGSTAHVEEALKHNIDMLWIGARTTVNPFYVQEIAEALRGVDVPILIKNPLHADVSLWIGAIERFSTVGVKRIAAVHRGFYTNQPAPYRNEPKWELSFELRSQMPNIPILCDPSHIAGRRDLIQQVAQTALDIDLDGLMIETHCNPEKALSDAAQQLTPKALQNLIDGLIIRSPEADNELIERKLSDLRFRIDQLDHDLIEKLAQRFTQVQEIGWVKKADDITVFQMERWYDLMTERKEFGALKGLDANLLHELFSVIHKYSVKHQTDIINKD